MPRDNEGDLLELDPNEPQEPQEETPAVDPKPEKKEEGTATERELRRALRDTRSALRQTTEALKYASEGRREPAAPKEEEEPKLSVDLVEAITNNDQKAITKALRELGFVREGDVDSKVATGRVIQAKDQELYREYPDLADPKSEMFKLTAEIYNDLAQDKHLKNSGRLAEIAAKLAGKQLDTAPPARRRAAQDVDDDLDRDVDEDDDSEQDRVQRVRRQAGATGRRSTRTADQPGNDQLDATQRSIVAKLRAAGADITEDGYKKRAANGIRMSGLPTRRAKY